MKSKTNTTLTAASLLLVGLTSSLLAIPSSIEGNISFSGSATTDTTSLSTSTRFLSFREVTVGTPATTSGDYLGTNGSEVTMTPFSWNPTNASIPINPLWTFVSGGNTYSFNLNTMNVDYVSPTALFLSGFGTASISGPGLEKLDTPGLWNFSGQTLGDNSFTFSSSNLVPTPPSRVPDNGMTVTMLGLSLLGFGFLKRKIANCPST
jgi:hypothetical protein